MDNVNSERGQVTTPVHQNTISGVAAAPSLIPVRMPPVVQPPTPKPSIWPVRKPPVPAPGTDKETKDGHVQNETKTGHAETPSLSEPYFSQLPTWQHGQDVPGEIKPITNEPAAYRLVDVLPGERLADLTRRVYGSNNVINRLRIELANGGNISGTVRIPK